MAKIRWTAQRLVTGTRVNKPVPRAVRLAPRALVHPGPRAARVHGGQVCAPVCRFIGRTYTRESAGPALQPQRSTRTPQCAITARGGRWAGR